jgi:hypothetical protein
MLAVDGKGESDLEYSLHQGNTEVRLIADDLAMSPFATGAVVTARGMLTPDGLIAAADGITVQQESPAIDATSGDTRAYGPGPFVRNVLVIDFMLAGQSNQPWSQASASNTFNGQNSRWFAEGSYGQEVLYADVTPWLRISAGTGTCSTNTWATQAQAAARAAGYEPNDYNNVVFAFPRVSACTWSGLGQVPGRFTWLNGSLSAARHELGHNLGLRHSHFRSCDGPEPLAGNCTNVEYGDSFDVMGNGGLAGFHGPYRAAVGWIPVSDVVTINSDTTVGLYPIATPSGARVLQVRLPGSSNSLWIEQRTADGEFDSVLSRFPALATGLPIYVGANMRENWLVDVYQTSRAADAPLQFGDTLYTSGVFVTPYAPGENGVAYVDVAYA